MTIKFLGIGVKRMDRIRNTIFGEVGIENLLARLQNIQLQWFGHLKKMVQTRISRILELTIQKKMVYQGTGKYQEERKELKRDKKGRTVERKNKLKTFSSQNRNYAI